MALQEPDPGRQLPRLHMGRVLAAVEPLEAPYEPPAPVWTGPPVFVSEAEYAQWERARRRAIAQNRAEADRDRAGERRRIDHKQLQEDMVAALQQRVLDQDERIEQLTARLQNLAELAKDLTNLVLGDT